MENNKLNKTILVTVVLVLALLGAAVVGVMPFGGKAAVAANAAQTSEATEDANEGPDVPITGSALERASAVALDYAGEGRVTGTEVGDEEGYYEIEVTLNSGRQVDIHLDESFNVLSQISDSD